MLKPLAALVLVGLLAGTAAADPLSPEAVPAPSHEDGSLAVAGDPVAADAPGARWVVSVDYILWWLREGRLPPTLTTSSQASRGLLGQPDTRLLYGGDRIPTRHGDRFNGVRPTLAFWFDDARTVGVEAGAFFLERDSTHFKAVSDGGTLLARVYENADGSPASSVVAGQAPAGLRNGGFVGYSRVELFGEEANLVAAVLTGDGFRVEALAGARFLQMRDRTDLTATGRTLPKTTTLFGLEDHYRVEDAYYGAQVGLRGEVTRGRWFANLRAETGLGANAAHLRAFGSTLYQTPAERLVTPTGLTVQASNSGGYDRAALNMVSEAGLNVGCRLTDHFALYVGYTFLLWDSPMRSGDQIDPVVNGTTRPAIPFREDLFWAQGLNAGAELKW
ncbi:MAG TPA: BBP7 family outer membrane beta-barrel protein [Gemmataceae bacterium]|nr:BBP7 family outer membrane beta-barrel protein [Gemmataceae bacterium]